MNLKISIIQTELYWENPTNNLAMFTQKIASINDATDVIVLPEMFTTGFTMNSEKLAETMDGKIIAWMKEQAKNKNAAIVGSIIIKDQIISPSGRPRGTFYNRLLWVFPDGAIKHYDKHHLFRMAGENNYFSPGKTRLIVEFKGWKICPMICYDLRFPAWSRNIHFGKKTNEPVFDCLIYVANWPEPRVSHWEKLLEARAIENQCYVVGVNRIGKDANNITYSGSSAVINPKGEKLSNTQSHQEKIETITLNYDEMKHYREKFPAIQDADSISFN
ncbi:MAG: amidohydrolase [Vicingaceae bacterium]|nr:amidohydrolase [Vicingaceae bacterium]